MTITYEHDAPKNYTTSHGKQVDLVGGKYTLRLDLAGVGPEVEDALRRNGTLARIQGRLVDELMRARDNVEAGMRTAKDEAADRARVRAVLADRKAKGLPAPANMIVGAGTKDPAAIVVVPA